MSDVSDVSDVSDLASSPNPSIIGQIILHLSSFIFHPAADYRCDIFHPAADYRCDILLSLIRTFDLRSKVGGGSTIKKK